MRSSLLLRLYWRFNVAGVGSFPGLASQEGNRVIQASEAMHPARQRTLQGHPPDRTHRWVMQSPFVLGAARDLFVLLPQS